MACIEVWCAHTGEGTHLWDHRKDHGWRLSFGDDPISNELKHNNAIQEYLVNLRERMQLSDETYRRFTF